MNKNAGLFLLLLPIAYFSSAQIRIDKLELSAKQEYFVKGTDVLVIDTLIMADSSRIILNREKKENIINVKVGIFGRGAKISGHGGDGDNGKPGLNGINQTAPCRVGDDAGSGSNGVRGKNGLNLSLYVGSLIIKGSLIIDLNGGNGGAGGNGGRGGDGGAGTRVCQGGNGGVGGLGGDGANGGNGGNLLMTCTQCPDLHLLQDDRLFIRTYGGFAGTGADGGAGGSAGLGPTIDGKNGSKGLPGINGEAGKRGAVNFEKK